MKGRYAGIILHRIARSLDGSASRRRHFGVTQHGVVAAAAAGFPPSPRRGNSSSVDGDGITQSPSHQLMPRGDIRRTASFHAAALTRGPNIRQNGLIPSNPLAGTTITGLLRPSAWSSTVQPRRTVVAEVGMTTRRFFQSESEYHTVADETLEDIQDAVEGALEDSKLEEFEVVLANGVLTMTFPPHGTWVLNKQTPNRQIWWSSPISGPRRYEHEDGEWVFTRDDAHGMTLKQAITDEVFQIYQIQLKLE
jgi:frataxin